MKKKDKKIALFEGIKIRRHWDNKKELWYFAIMDIIAVLTDSNNPQVYWRVLKKRLKDEGSSETVTKCNALKMRAADGKMRLTDVADTETVLRLVQSVPSPNAEPLKLWLAKVGYERIEETDDPEIAINRALKTYLKKGYSPEWVNQRMKSIEIRKALTDEWEYRGVKEGSEFAILTDEITQAWAGLTTRQYKNLKGLKKESLRDNMANIELIFNMLGEASTTEIARNKDARGFHENKKAAKEGGDVAGNARKELEKKSGKKVVSKNNYLKGNTKKKLDGK